MAESKQPRKNNTEGALPFNTVPCDCSASGGTADCGDTSQPPSGRTWAKTAVAGVVLIAAVSAAGYSIIRDNSPPPAPTDLIEASAVGASATSTCAPSLFNLGNDSTVSPIAVAVLTSVVSGVDVAFVMLSGPDNDAAQSALAEVESIVVNLTAQGKKVKAVSFASGSPGYVGLVQFGKLNSFPTVAALGSKGGYTFLGPDEISETKLLRSFVVAATPAPSCAPGSPGCGPVGGK